jgi:hypothetical protein
LVVVVANTPARTLFDAAGSSRLGRCRGARKVRLFAFFLLRQHLAIV